MLEGWMRIHGVQPKRLQVSVGRAWEPKAPAMSYGVQFTPSGI
jgi:hypothetical protein